MSDDWNPTIQTPGGKEVTIENDRVRPRHQQKSELQALIDDGLTTEEMAAKLGVGPSTIRRQCNNHGLTLPGEKTESEPDRELNDTLHEENGVNYHNKPDTGATETPSMHPCPECGIEYVTEESQHTCMRTHSRELANELAAEAAAGTEVLPL